MNEHKRNSEEITVSEAILLVETAISEGHLSSKTFTGEQAMNMFGRPVIFNATTDLSYLSGLASTGLRASALVDIKDLLANYNQLTAMAGQHLATVVHTQANHHGYHTVADAGFFQLFASDPQEAVDFTMIAHRISELSLIPGICAFEESTAGFTLPSEEVMTKYLGDPDGHINCPTAAQQIIFGNTRRRVPNWFSLDYPMATGSMKGEQALAFEAAANHKYFYDHLPELVAQALEEFNAVSGNDYAPIAAYQASKAQHLVLTQGTLFHKVKVIVDSLNQKQERVGCLNLSMLRPFPGELLMNFLRGKQSVTVLENTNHSLLVDGPIYTELLGALQQHHVSLNVYSGQYGADPSDKDIAAVFNNMANNGKQKFYLGIDFTHEISKFPKHEVLLGNIRRKYPDVQKSSLTGTPKTEAEKRITLDYPRTIRQYQDHGPAYTKLARFFDDTGYFYKTGQGGELVADPFQAIPMIPPATANFADVVSQRELVPKFNPQNCTGCGNCFVSCPHSALPPIAIGLEDLIKAGAKISTKRGLAITKLTPHVKNIAKLSAKAINEREGQNHIGDFLQAGFDDLIKQSGLEGEKLQEIKADFAAILEVVQDFPAAITDPFFQQPNRQDQNSGEIFSLAVDPHACTGCGVCVSVCNDEALELVVQTTEVVNEMQATFQLWEQLPDTNGDTINRMHHDEQYDSFAAIMLSRNYYMTMTGGGSTESDAPAKSLMHLLTAATESAIQPKIIAQIKEIDQLLSSLNENIHKRLSEALPREDYNSLERALKASKGMMTPFNEVIGKMGEQDLMKQLDTEVVQRKITLTQALKDLKWVLSQGPTGIGRSRYGIAMSGRTPWSGEYPYNNFTVPAIINWDGAVPELAQGLFQGLLRYLLDNIKLLRRAKLEAKDKYDPKIHDSEIANLSWKDLAEEEKAQVPPILVIGDQTALGERSWLGLSQVLLGDWPVKVIIVANAQINHNADPTKAGAQNSATLLSTMAGKNAFVLQGSMADPSHLFNGLLEGMQSPKPALFSLFAPDPEKHFIADDGWPKLAYIAWKSRAFPSLRFSTDHKSSYFSSALHIDTNPNASDNWCTETVIYLEAGVKQSIDYTITWADWAYSLQAWRPYYSTYKEEVGTALQVADYLKLSDAARTGHVPVIIRAKGGHLQYYAVSPKIVEACEAILITWNTWRELAGMLTEFPKKLRMHVEKELSTKFEGDLVQAKADFALRLKEQEQEQVETIRQKLENKLVALAKQGKNEIG